MEQRFELGKPDPRLWTRPKAVPIRERVEQTLSTLPSGGTLIIDAAAVEIFDLSFAAELFGKTVLRLAHDYPGRFFVVEHLNVHARENLEAALKQLDLAMIERNDGHPRLIGKYHPTDEETLEAIFSAGVPVTAADLRDRLDLTINAANERLSKLVQFGVVRRERGKSPAGREQFLYSVLR